jgi:inward rectifier potassium channel
MAMAQEAFDPGLTKQFGGRIRRTINKDGSFNVHRVGTRIRDSNLYLFLVSVRWPYFLGLIVATYCLANVIFGLIYLWIGVNQLQGADSSTPVRAFLSAYFFSAHTLTTVGYGNIAPSGTLSNCVAAMEALLGLLGFAVATGLLVGRVSKPSARIAYSGSVLITPYQDITSLQFRIANQRQNSIMELEAKVMLMVVDECSGGLKRDYHVLELAIPGIYFFPLTWTIVHPINEGSPLYQKTADDLKRLQIEVLILIKGFDETFGQVVHSRHSYTHEEVVWGGSFAPAFHVDQEGDLVLNVDSVGRLKEA